MNKPNGKANMRRYFFTKLIFRWKRLNESYKLDLMKHTQPLKRDCDCDHHTEKVHKVLSSVSFCYSTSFQSVWSL